MASLLLYAHLNGERYFAVTSEILKKNIVKNSTEAKLESYIEPEDFIILVANYYREEAEIYSERFKEFVKENNISRRYVGINHYRFDIFEVYLYSQNRYALELPLQIKYFHCDIYRIGSDAGTHTIFISLEDYTPMPFGIFYFIFFADLGRLLSTHFSRIPPLTKGALKEQRGDSLWTWPGPQHDGAKAGLGHGLHRAAAGVALVVKAVAAFALVSVVTSFAVRVAIMASSAFLIFSGKREINGVVELAECCGNTNGWVRTEVLHMVPWMGIHEANLRRTGRPRSCLVLAFICFFLTIYLTFKLVSGMLYSLFFGQETMSHSEAERYFLYVECFDFLMFAFIRSRVSILYFARIFSVFNVLYLFYCFAYPLAYPTIALALLQALTMLVVLLLLKLIERPAVGRNSFAAHTPSYENPRHVYLHVLKSQFSLGFSILSLFHAPSFRSEFQPTEQHEMATGARPIQFDFSDSVLDEEAHNENE